MGELTNFEFDGERKIIKGRMPGKVIMNERTRAFMRFFSKEYGAKFIDEETGEVIRVDES